MKRTVLLILSALMIISSVSVFAEEDSDKTLKVHDYVQMGTYCGEPIIWEIAGFGWIGAEEGSDIPSVADSSNEVQKEGYLPLLVSDEILCLKAFDAAKTVETDEGSHSRRKSGKASNYWKDSTLRAWLNSSAQSGEVEWLCKNPPSEEAVWNGYNAYDNEAGFLTNFSEAERNCIQTVKHKVYVPKPEADEKLYEEEIKIPTYGGVFNYKYKDSVIDTVFIPSMPQQYEGKGNGAVIGEVCTKNSKCDKANFNPGNKWDSWLIDPSDNEINVATITQFGNYYQERADNGRIGVRPAMYLKEDTVFASGSGTKEDPYVIKSADIPQEFPSPEPTVSPKPTASPSPESGKRVLTIHGGNELSADIDGKSVEFTDAKPFVDESNRTQMPVRVISEMLECDVAWNDALKTVVVNALDGKVITLSVGTNVMSIDGEETQMDTAALIKDGRTYIPVRFVAEALGLEVQWDKQ